MLKEHISKCCTFHDNPFTITNFISEGGLLVVANNEDVNTWVKLQGNGTRKWIGATDQVIYDMTPV